MKIAVIGYGAMGRLVADLAERGGHEVKAVVRGADAESPAGRISETLAGCDVAIDFSSASAVRRNLEACLASGVPLVEGTTGWDGEREAARSAVLRANGSFVFGANFSIGMNLFYRIAEHAAKLFSGYREYEAFIEEQHHSRKKDAPSGTALKLKSILAENLDQEISVAATRAGNIPGTHRVGFDGPADQILLEHNSRSREGFAAGALLAAEWIIGKTGFYEFTTVMDDICQTRER